MDRSAALRPSLALLWAGSSPAAPPTAAPFPERDQTLTDIETRLARAFLGHDTGLDSVLDVVHSDDDMYRYLTTVQDIAPHFRRLQYFRSGREALDVLHHLLHCSGRELAQEPAVLEFACGFGRGTRFLTRVVPPERVWVSDVLPGSVEFLQEQFGVQGFRSDTDPGRMGLHGPFSTVTVVSLFSHLPEPRFRGWLERLGSWLDDDGLLVFTTHGSPSDGSAFQFVASSESATLDVAEYGSTWVDPRWVADAARCAGFAFHRHRVRELEGHQDVHVVAKRPPPNWQEWSPCPLPRGRIDRLNTDDRQFLLEGWAALPAERRVADAVELLWDDRPIGEAVLGTPRDDVASAFAVDALRGSGWKLVGALPSLPPGRSILTARSPDPSGTMRVLDVASLHVDGEGRVSLER